MKTMKKILLILCIIIIVIGMFILGRNGLNYVDGYSEGLLLGTIKSYTFYLIISTLIIVTYITIRYHKQGILKVLLTTILGVIGALLLAISIIAISRMDASRMIISELLITYVSSIIAITAYFEENN